jgi:acetyl/propionyl-CoA carboxylase alpha subunit/acetyl-CoA carboxylase carboxyltransferase component
VTTISRLAVIDRGETAVRVLSAVRGLAQDDEAVVATVLVHAEPELHPWYGREADEVVAVPPPITGAAPEAVVQQLQRVDADAAWIGDVPERLALVTACERAGLVLIGPDSDVIRAAAAVGDRSPVGSSSRHRRAEVDILADDHGTIWCLGGRDVSMRHAGRMLIAESPCAAIGDELSEHLRREAVAVARRIGYRGAGVVSFTHDGDTYRLDGVDVTAAPVHAATEERTGASLIGHRIRVARGERLPVTEPSGQGVVVAAHLIADPPPVDAQLEKSGRRRVALLAFPTGTGVRIDANRRPGDQVTSDDPLLAIVTAWGPDRRTALGRLQRALERTSIVLTSGGTNRSLLLAIARHPDMVDGAIDDGWLDRHLDELLDAPADPVALLAAAVEAYEVDRRLAQDAFLGAAARGRPEQPRDVGDRIQLYYCGNQYDLSVDRTGPDSYSVRHGRALATVLVDRLDTYQRRLTCRGRTHRVVVAPTGDGWLIEVDAVAHTVVRDDGTVVRSDWPALVVEVAVAPGDEVAAGDPIVVLESMKMETTVGAPFAGEVTAVHVVANNQVERGAALMRVRRHHEHPVQASAGVDLHGFERRRDPSRKPCQQVYEPLGNYVLGYDLGSDELHRLLVEQRRLAEIASPADVDLIACEDSLLDIYADLGALSRPRSELDTEIVSELTEEHTQEFLTAFVQWLDADRAGLTDSYRARLERALARYGVHGLDRSPDLERAVTWLFRSLDRLDELSGVVEAILQRRLDHRRVLAPVLGADDGARLDRLAAATQGRQQMIADLARDVRFHFFSAPAMEAEAMALLAEMADHFEALANAPDAPGRAEHIDRLVRCPHPLRSEMQRQWRLSDDGDAVGSARRTAVAEVHIRRYYRLCDIGPIRDQLIDGYHVTTTEYSGDEGDVDLVVGFVPLDDLPGLARTVSKLAGGIDPRRQLVIDVTTWRDGEIPPIDRTAARVLELVDANGFGRRVDRLTVTVTSATGSEEEHLRTQSVTLRQHADGSWSEDELLRNLHPMIAERLEIWRLANFQLERRPSPEDVYLFLGVAHENPADRRLFAVAEVRELTRTTDPVTGEVHYPRLERTGLLALAAMRAELSRHTRRDRPAANRLVLDITTPWIVPAPDVRQLSDRFAPLARRSGLEKVVLKVRSPDEDQPDGLRPAVLQFEGVGQSVLVREHHAGHEPVKPLGKYRQKVLTAARYGAPYPYEITRLLTRRGPRDGLPADSFVELDLAPDRSPSDADRLVTVDREPGDNTAHIVVGLVTRHTATVPEGIRRIALLSDPTQGFGNLAEPECRRVNAALAYALEHRIPVEWFAVSSGALISMDSGTENMDWIALTLRRLIEFTQAGGEVNIVITGINVGGQPYWNAEATMLMHTKGILVMSPASTMVLTGKQALDYSGAVSAPDNQGIGGYERVMGPNGQAQYFAASFTEACEILHHHYELTYVVPGERFPRRRPTTDPTERDVRASPHVGPNFTSVGDIFSEELNPDRKQPFDMRSLMRAVADADAEQLERWRDLRDGDTSIVWDTTIGGIPVCLLGIESHTVPRRGYVPADGPPAWTSGTLFPQSSRKTARAINAATANRPLVVLANLSGFDGSPESMRRRQLEFGAEIGRAITNFDGPIVFVVVSRYHGGAFVVFSKRLNESMEIAAVEGSFASVIGGAPAAATVFAREVTKRTQRDERVRAAVEAAARADGPEAATRRSELTAITAQVRSEKLGEVAHEFDEVHTIERAQHVGSVDRIIPASRLRPYVIEALERGMSRHGTTARSRGAQASGRSTQL